MFKKIFSRSFIDLQRISLKTFADNIHITRPIYCGVCLRNLKHTEKSNSTSPALSSKYQVITDINSSVIVNTAEETRSIEGKYPILSDEFDGLNLERGKNGVFEIKDLVEILHRENSKDIFVASVPQNIRYVDYICVVSARNKRHILAIIEFVRKVYKKKCYKSDPVPRIEGKESDEWMALDLGNIALHVFSAKARSIYDLETLWSVGPEFDDQTNKKSDITEIFENYSNYLKDLKPLE